MHVSLQPATTDDVPELVSLSAAVNVRLTEKGALFAMRNSSVFIARRRGKVIATLTLSTKKPWAIDRKYFSACKRPLYLTAMAVHPVGEQRNGVGKLRIVEGLPDRARMACRRDLPRRLRQSHRSGRVLPEVRFPRGWPGGLSKYPAHLLRNAAGVRNWSPWPSKNSWEAFPDFRNTFSRSTRIFSRSWHTGSGRTRFSSPARIPGLIPAC